MIIVIIVVIVVIFKNTDIVIKDTNSHRHSNLAINISTNDDRQHDSNTCSNNRNRNGTTKMMYGK